MGKGPASKIELLGEKHKKQPRYTALMMKRRPGPKGRGAVTQKKGLGTQVVR